MIVQLGYIKQKTSRLENLLMIVPLIAVLFTSYFSKLAALDNVYATTYISFSFVNVVIFSWALLIIPFLLHLFLKQQNIGNSTIINTHILLSLVLLVSLIFSYDLYMPVSLVNQQSFWGIPYQRHWLEASFQTFVLLALQLFLQLVFSIYSLMKLLP
ncbi:MAG: hypothetical protein NTY72_09285 [Bacteroidetes bacterium]|nr:hypothetical protein [Bacteroidota bacterium]